MTKKIKKTDQEKEDKRIVDMYTKLVIRASSEFVDMVQKGDAFCDAGQKIIDKFGFSVYDAMTDSIHRVLKKQGH